MLTTHVVNSYNAEMYSKRKETIPTAIFSLMAILMVVSSSSCRQLVQESPSTKPNSKSLRQLAIDSDHQRISTRIEAGGGMDLITFRLRPFRNQMINRLNTSKVHYFKGYDGHLFQKGGVVYLLDENLTFMSGLNGPQSPVQIVADLHEQLKSKGIDLIFFPIPSRVEVFPDKLTTMAPSDLWVSPQLDIFLLSLMDAGVETIDLRQDFLEARDQVEEPFYPLTDSHWGGDAIRISARRLAERLKRYEFAKEAGKKPARYSTKSITVKRRGSLVRPLPDEEKAKYPLDRETVYQVMESDGELYRDADNSPVAIVGDSFVMRNTKEGGSISANLAKELNWGVTAISSASGGTKVPRTLARKGPEFLEGRRVVIWMMATRYLSDMHGQEWATAQLP